MGNEPGTQPNSTRKTNNRAIDRMLHPTQAELQQLEIETMTLFPLGATVRLSAKGRGQFVHQRWERLGKVVGYAPGGDFRLGFCAIVNVCVHWDGVKQPSTGVYRDNLEVVPL